MKLQKVCEATQQNPVGFASLIISLLCGSLYLVTVLIPVLLRRDNLLATVAAADFWIITLVLGSGLALLLALLSFGMERRIGPAVASICVLALTENLVFPGMPFWTVMLLGAWSAWAVVAYIAGFVAALVLIARRAITGDVVLAAPLRLGRCPLFSAAKGTMGLR